MTMITKEAAMQFVFIEWRYVTTREWVRMPGAMSREHAESMIDYW